MHFPYENKLNHRADFRVRYRFYSEQEGGRKMLPYQGYRSDFWYDHSEHRETNHLFMIWPEFEDDNGDIILENSISVSVTGTARMWVIMPERRNYHLDKIHVGITGYFMEGSRRSAICEVIEILDLPNNPTIDPRPSYELV